MTARASLPGSGDGPTALDVPVQLAIRGNGGDGPTALEMGRFEGGTNSVGGNHAALYTELRAIKLLEELPNEELRAAYMVQAIRRRSLQRDEIVTHDGGLVLVLSGQVALARFAPDVLQDEWGHLKRLVESTEPQVALKSERKRRELVGTMAERARRNLALFEAGDLLEPAPPDDRPAELGCYAVTPAVVVTFDRALVEQWAQAHQSVADRFRRATDLARARLAATDGAQAMVADFFVRHGLSISQTLRVRRLDTCVSCGACEAACETRYGVKRLSLNGRIMGGLDFVDACHTCSDQRCIDPCNFDAISFDPVRKEVLIKEDACTGCTLCARSCPYDAIEMHDLDNNPLLQLRLQKEKKLEFGDGLPRKARLRRIASKCDHCAFYPDQACVSACPTGALLELAPSDVVPKLPQALRNMTLSGFDVSAGLDLSELNSPSAFMVGALDVPKLGHAKAVRTPMPLKLMWTAGLGALVLVMVEIGLRLWAPLSSLQYWMDTALEGLEPELALEHIDYHAGCPLAVQLGWTGMALLVLSLSYVPRKRLSFLRRFGALQAWFEVHIVTSVVGAAFVALHTAARLDNWVSIPFWAMMLTVLSGLAGRVLATQVPQASVALELAELKHRLAQLRATEAGARAAMRWLDRYRRRMPKPKAGLFRELGALLWLMGDELLRPLRVWQLRSSLRQGLGGWKRRAYRGEVTRLVSDLARTERRQLLDEPLRRVLSSWKAVHVPMATILGLLAGLHIYLALHSLP